MALESNTKSFQRQPPYTRLPLLIVLMTGITLVIGIIALHYLESRLIAAKGENLASAAADIADKLDLLLYERYTDIQILSQNPVFQGDDTAAKNAALDTFKRFYPIYRWLGATDAHAI